MSDEHVDRGVADDLVGDPPAWRLGESGLGDLGHGQTVCRAPHRDARPTGLWIPSGRVGPSTVQSWPSASYGPPLKTYVSHFDPVIGM